MGTSYMNQWRGMTISNKEQANNCKSQRIKNKCLAHPPPESGGNRMKKCYGLKMLFIVLPGLLIPQIAISATATWTNIGPTLTG